MNENRDGGSTVQAKMAAGFFLMLFFVMFFVMIVNIIIAVRQSSNGKGDIYSYSISVSTLSALTGLSSLVYAGWTAGKGIAIAKVEDGAKFSKPKEKEEAEEWIKFYKRRKGWIFALWALFLALVIVTVVMSYITYFSARGKYPFTEDETLSEATLASVVTSTVLLFILLSALSFRMFLSDSVPDGIENENENKK